MTKFEANGAFTHFQENFTIFSGKKFSTSYEI